MVTETKKYFIEIFYETGGSFNLWDETDKLELQWDNLEIAKENLERIKKHYLWYKDNNGYKVMSKRNKPPVEKPDFMNDMEFDHCIRLLTDERVDCQIAVFWCGYFETLYSAKIKEHIKDNSDMIFVTE